MLTAVTAPRYASLAGAKSSAGFGDSELNRRTSAHRETGAFFASTVRVYGGCAWETARSAGFLFVRFANLRTATPKHCLATVEDGSNQVGVSPMFPTHNPSARAAAHRAMAKSALFADSSAAVRLKRYNTHMTKARRMESAASAQGVTA